MKCVTDQLRFPIGLVFGGEQLLKPSSKLKLFRSECAQLILSVLAYRYILRRSLKGNPPGLVRWSSHQVNIVGLFLQQRAFANVCRVLYDGIDVRGWQRGQGRFIGEESDGMKPLKALQLQNVHAQLYSQHLLLSPARGFGLHFRQVPGIYRLRRQMVSIERRSSV